MKKKRRFSFESSRSSGWLLANGTVSSRVRETKYGEQSPGHAADRDSPACKRDRLCRSLPGVTPRASSTTPATRLVRCPRRLASVILQRNRGAAMTRRRDGKYWDVMMARTRAKTPRFVEAVVTDAKVLAVARGERYRFRGRFDALCQALRLMWVSEAFLAQTCYRAQARLDALGVRVLPRLM